MAMDTASLKDSHSPVLSSPFSSPNVAALLKIKIISWSQETGLPVSVRVQVADRTFNLNCQKLSQEMCIEAVQNELMPLRLIVQALFVQQLNTHLAFKECSDSFRYAHGVEFSGSPSSSRYANSKSQNLSESPYIDGGGEAVSRPLSFLIQRDIAIQRSECSRKEYESTSFRIQSLEQELMSLKKSLQLENISQETDPVVKKSEAANSLNFMPYSSLSRQRNPLGQVRACIGSVNFASHRKYASRIMKVFRRIRLFGRGKSKKEPGASTVWP